jgi:hypothetical protein
MRTNSVDSVGIKDGANLDAFSRLRTSQSHSLFDSQFTYDLQPLLFEQITAESGATIAHDTTNRCATMTLSDTPTGGKAFMQSFEHFRYTSGKGQLIFATFNFKEAKANTLKFVGYSDGTNGMEFQLSGTTKQFKISSSTGAGDETVAQSSWNLDKLDGTGKSGITLDITKTQIFVLDFQALYVGRVRMGFDIDGQIIYCHEFDHANNIANPYVQSANLPLRCGVTCTGTVSTTVDFICSTVIQENGSFSNEGYHFAQEGTATAANGARTHILSVQPKATFNSIANRSKFILESLEITVTGNSPVKWELCLGDVITGTTAFNDVNATYSAVEYNILGTTSGSPAIVIHSGYVAASAQNKTSESITIPFKYPICLNAAGAARPLGRLTVLVTGIGGNSASRATISWKEIR